MEMLLHKPLDKSDTARYLCSLVIIMRVQMYADTQLFICTFYICISICHVTVDLIGYKCQPCEKSLDACLQHTMYATELSMGE